MLIHTKIKGKNESISWFMFIFIVSSLPVCNLYFMYKDGKHVKYKDNYSETNLEELRWYLFQFCVKDKEGGNMAKFVVTSWPKICKAYAI